jgi:hypothetical protein
MPLPLLGFVGAVSGITYNVRFVCWLAIPMAFITARALEPHESKRTEGRIVACLAYLCILAITCYANHARVFFSRYQFEDTRSLAGYIDSKGQKNEPVYVVSDYLRSPISYYLGESFEVFELHELGKHSRVFETKELAIESVNKIARTGRNAWIVYGRPFHGDPQGFFLEELKKTAKEHHAFVGLQLFRFDAKPDSPNSKQDRRAIRGARNDDSRTGYASGFH